MSPWTLRGAAGQDPENKISTSTEFLNFCDWFVRSIANDKHTTCAEYTLLQANVPSNSNQDRKQALELKNAWMARYKKEFAPSGQAAATTAAVADKAAGRNVYNMLMVRFSGDVECKLKGVKDKHDADLDAYEEQEDGDGIEHPGNLATLIWEALHRHFAPSAPTSVAHRMAINQEKLLKLHAVINDKDKHAGHMIAALPALIEAQTQVRTNLTLDQCNTLLTVAKMVANDHPYRAIAQEFMNKPLEEVSLNNLLNAIQEQRARTGVSDVQVTDAYSAGTLHPGTHTHEGVVVCTRCHRPSNGEHHTAFNCRTALPAKSNGKSSAGQTYRRSTRKKAATVAKTNSTTQIKGNKAFMSRLEDAKEEAIENGESRFVVHGRVFELSEGDGDSIKELKIYSSSRVTAQPILDCGAQRTISNTCADTPRRTTTRIRGVGGVLNGNADAGTVILNTSTVDGKLHIVRFPDSLVHSDVSTTLISYHGLLKKGYRIRIHLKGGTVTTPKGEKIELTLNDGLWSFPPPPHQARNIFQAIAMDAQVDDSREEGKDDNKLGTVEPTADDADKAQALHNRLGHPGKNRMLIIERMMDRDDPAKPSRAAIRALDCPHCAIANSQVPPESQAHPRRTDHDDEIPGQVTSLDLSGLLPPDVEQLGGFKTTVVLKDHASGLSTFISLKDKKPASIIGALEEYLAKLDRTQAGLKKLVLRGDAEFLATSLKAWGHKNNIDIQGAPPLEHSSNGRAESSVNLGKSKTRAAREVSGAGKEYIGHILPYVGIQEAFLPSSVDPLKKQRTPAEIWPDFPFRHRKLRHDIPWGCLAVRHQGKVLTRNYTRRGRPCIFLGWSRKTPSYLLLDLETNKTVEGTYVHFFTDRFPLKERLQAGEALPSLSHINIDGWRQVAHEQIDTISDEDLGNFAAGKQIEVVFPANAFPGDAPHQWSARVHGLVPPRKGMPTMVDVQYTNFSGTDDQMQRPSDAQYRNKALLQQIPVTMPKGTTHDCSLRTALSYTYPLAKHCHELASLSAARTNRFTTTRAIDRDETDDDTPPEEDSSSSGGVSTASPPRQQPTQVSTDSTRRITRASTRLATLMRIEARVAAGKRVGPKKCPSSGAHFITNSKPKVHFSPMVQYHHYPTRTAGGKITNMSVPVQDNYLAGASSETTQHTKTDNAKIGFEPRNIRQAKAHPSWPEWQRAIHKENDGLRQRGTYIRVRRCEVPKGVQLLHSMYTFRDKPGGAKARLVVQGHRQRPLPPPSETYASTPLPAAVRTLLALAVQQDMDIDKIDISQAFVQSEDLKPGSQLYLIPPPEANEDPSYVWKLVKPLYGLSIAPRAWSQTLRNYLISQGWQPVAHEDTVYSLIQGDKRMQLTFHVDDILLAYNAAAHAKAAKFKKALLSRFDGRDEGPLTTYLGVDVNYNKSAGTLKISQEELIRDLLERTGLSDCNPVSTPLPPGTRLAKPSPNTVLDKALGVRYREVVGTLQYLATWTRVDIAHAAHCLAKHSAAPTEEHWKAAKHTLRYLKGTCSDGITYARLPSSHPHANKLFGYSDSDWAACVDTRKSVGAYVLFLNGGPVSWRSKQQTSVALSTCEAEFMAASKASTEALWLRRILAGLGCVQRTCTPLYEDNRAALLLADNPVHKERTKHIDMHLHSLRERVANGVVKLIQCPTHDMTADALTKALPAPAFRRHREVLFGRAPHTAPEFHSTLYALVAIERCIYS